MARILLIEDEPALVEVLTDILETEGHRVLVARDGESGIESALSEKPALTLLDIMLPKINGFDVCSELRKRGHHSPVLMLTAKDRIEDRVRGLDCGADDYLVKPFSTREMLARVRALLRRNDDSNPQNIIQIAFGDVTVDFVKVECVKSGESVSLKAKEFAMLRLMAANPGRAISREDFLDQVWNYHSFPTTRTVDNHIASLRAKLETAPNDPKWIKTVHGIGYQLDC